MRRRTLRASLAVLLLLGASFAFAYSTGPPASRTGAFPVASRPGESNCTICHNSVPVNSLVGTPAGVDHFVEDHELGLFTRDDFAAAFDAAGLRLEYDPIGPGGVGLYIGRAG